MSSPPFQTEVPTTAESEADGLWDEDEMDQLDARQSAPPDDAAAFGDDIVVDQQLLHNRVVTHVSVSRVAKCKRFIEQQQKKAMASYENFQLTAADDISRFIRDRTKFSYSDESDMITALRQLKAQFMDGQRRAYTDLKVRRVPST